MLGFVVVKDYLGELGGGKAAEHGGLETSVPARSWGMQALEMAIWG